MKQFFTLFVISLCCDGFSSQFIDDQPSLIPTRKEPYGNNFWPSPQSKRQFLTVIHQWNQLDFEYSSGRQKLADINSGEFVPGKVVPIDVDVHYTRGNRENRIFVASPRIQNGSSATLSTLSHDNRFGNSKLIPYPAWRWHRNASQCRSERLVSVYRVMIDPSCNRLWVLDNGKFIDAQVCPPQILAFDLDTDRLVYKHEIPKSLLYDQTLLVTPMVDVRNSCEDVFIYSADCQTNSIFIHSMRNKSSWKAQDKTMYPDPVYGTYNINGETFELMDGVLGMALEPYKPGRERRLFYHALTSGTEQYVPTSMLRDSQKFQSNPNSSPQIYTQFQHKRGAQSAAEAISRDGIMFFGLVGRYQIACYNTNFQYGPESIDIVAEDPETLQFISGMKIIRNRRNVEELWILTSPFQKVMNGNLNLNETNFRIMAGRVEDLIRGTRCDPRGFRPVNF